MPQASDDLRAMFPGGDAEALAYLSDFGVKECGGMIRVLNVDSYSKRFWAALDYLRDEWDYSIDLIDPDHFREDRAEGTGGLNG